MTEKEFGLLILTLCILVASVHLLGYLFERLKQPRLIGEILAGILLGPYVLGKLAPDAFHFLFGNPAAGPSKTMSILNFIYWLGVILLMFLSGSQVRRLLSEDNRRATAWLFGVGTPLPVLVVLGLCAASLIPLEALMGPKGVPAATFLVLACAVAVTSIPVISRIFHDLGILHTRFASLILGFAVLEDIALWGVLAVATALAKSDAGTHFIGKTSAHIVVTVTFMAAALTVMPRVLHKMRQTKYNVLFKASRMAYAMCVLFAYVGLAALLDVNLVFAAFLAGFGLAGGIAGAQRRWFTESLDATSRFAFAVFIPIYFALVGYRLVFGREFSPGLLLAFLVGSSAVALASRALAARLGGFRGLDVINLSVAANARGGPGIVLASIAYEAGIISAAFYTTLVITAIVTSQAAGLWLKHVLGKGWPLLSTNPEEKAKLEENVEGAVAAGH